jgi:hypothetical protein
MLGEKALLKHPPDTPALELLNQDVQLTNMGACL